MVKSMQMKIEMMGILRMEMDEILVVIMKTCISVLMELLLLQTLVHYVQKEPLLMLVKRHEILFEEMA